MHEHELRNPLPHGDQRWPEVERRANFILQKRVNAGTLFSDCVRCNTTGYPAVLEELELFTPPERWGKREFEALYGRIAPTTIPFARLLFESGFGSEWTLADVMSRLDGSPEDVRQDVAFIFTASLCLAVELDPPELDPLFGVGPNQAQEQTGIKILTNMLTPANIRGRYDRSAIEREISRKVHAALGLKYWGG